MLNLKFQLSNKAGYKFSLLTKFAWHRFNYSGKLSKKMVF